ncbi:Rib/alpha-like domain-containing protein, partial [Staphylococcus epidermidis]|uniref:Rib/alpha-like domain-containing protein n=1 Tax=Staphylococcus epidermidis TaxID=1282 RepID=UPI002FD8290D
MLMNQQRMKLQKITEHQQLSVTYPDGTQDHVTVPVTTNKQADNDAYEPTTDEVTKDYGTPTTE